jgi:hypothetical protein
MSYTVYLDEYDPSVIWSRLTDRFTYAEFHQLHTEVFAHVAQVPYAMKQVLIVEGRLPRENLAKHLAQVATQRGALPNLAVVIAVFANEFDCQHAETVARLMHDFEVTSSQPQVYHVLALETARLLLAQAPVAGV